MQESVTQDRERYIGGSDIPSIMGISPFTSRMDMLSFKAGIKENDFEGNSYTEYGNLMEGKIRDFINAEMGYSFEEDKKIDGILRYHADGISYDDETVLEVKTTSKIHDDIKDYKVYLVQLLLGMHMWKFKSGLLAVYERPEDMSEEFDRDRLQIHRIDQDDYEDLWEEVKTAIEEFENDLEYLKENPLVSEEELPSRYSLSEIGQRTLTIGDMEVSAEWLLGEEKTLTDAIKALKEELCNQMEEHNIRHCDFENGAKVTFVPRGEDSESMKFNEKKFQEDYPDTYDKYLEKKTRKGKKAYVLIKH